MKRPAPFQQGLCSACSTDPCARCAADEAARSPWARPRGQPQPTTSSSCCLSIPGARSQCQTSLLSLWALESTAGSHQRALLPASRTKARRSMAGAQAGGDAGAQTHNCFKRCGRTMLQESHEEPPEPSGRAGGCTGHCCSCRRLQNSQELVEKPPWHGSTGSAGSSTTVLAAPALVMLLRRPVGRTKQPRDAVPCPHLPPECPNPVPSSRPCCPRRALPVAARSR